MKDYNYDKDYDKDKDLEKFLDIKPDELAISHPMEKSLDSLLFEQSYKTVDRLKKLHSINARQMSYVDDQLQKCLDALSKARLSIDK